MQRTTTSRINDNLIVGSGEFVEFHSRVLTGGVEHLRRHWSVTYEGDVGGAVEWREIKLKTSCDVPVPLNQRRTTIFDRVPAPLNQRRTTIFDQRAPTFVPTLVVS